MPDWKGLLKKGTELAQQAKSELEERGVLGGEQQRSEPTGVGSQAPDQSPADQAREVTGEGHPHPFDLLTTEEVAAALGADASSVAPPTASISDGSAGPRWTVHLAGGAQIDVDLQLYVDAMDVDELTSYGDDAQRLLGVGDRAATSGSLVAVSRGGETVSITVDGAPDWQTGPALEALARAVAARLPDFREYAVRMSAPGGPVLTDVLPTDVVATALGVALDTPSIERRDNEVRVTWQEPPTPTTPDADDEEPDQFRVEVTHYLVDPWEHQQRKADSGGVFAKVAVQLGEAMKEQLAQHFTPVPGPWDEGYVGPAMAYFKKGGRSFKIEVEGAQRDTSPQIEALARRLAEGV